MSDTFQYHAFGLTISSDRPLSALGALAQGSCDVTITNRPIEPHLRGLSFEISHRNWKASPNIFYLEIEGVARFLVKNGTNIYIDQVNGASDDDVQSFLISSAIAALLQQRNLLTLHASAFRTRAGAVLLLGPSGAGKSTTLAGMVQRGYDAISDDICALRFSDEGQVFLQPGIAALRLWQDSADHLSYSNAVIAKVRKGGNKLIVPFEQLTGKELPISAIFRLCNPQSSKVELLRASQADAFHSLTQFTFRKRFYDGMGLQRMHFKMVSQITQLFGVTKICRPENFDFFEGLLDEIEKAIEHNQKDVVI